MDGAGIGLIGRKHVERNCCPSWRWSHQGLKLRAALPSISLPFGFWFTNATRVASMQPTIQFFDFFDRILGLAIECREPIHFLFHVGDLRVADSSQIIQLRDSFK